LVLGQTFLVRNLSTGIVTVNSSGANVVLAIPTLTTAIFTCILTSGTTAASWSVSSYLNTPSAGGAVVTPVTRYTTVFETAGRFLVTNNSGSSVFDNAGLTMDSGASSGAGTQTQVILYRGDALNNDNISPFAGSPTFSASISIMSLGTSGREWNANICIGDSTASAENDNRRKIGFQLRKTSGNVTGLFGVHNDSDTQSKTASLTTFALNDVIEVFCKVNGTASTDFYWRLNNGAWSSATNLTGSMPTNNTPFLMTCAVRDASGLGANAILKVQSASYER